MCPQTACVDVGDGEGRKEGGGERKDGGRSWAQRAVAFGMDGDDDMTHTHQNKLQQGVTTVGLYGMG